MNQVQWMKIREAEIIELLRCDSIVLVVKSTPTTERRDVERNTTSIKILFPYRCMLVCISNAYLYIRYIYINSSLKIFWFCFYQRCCIILFFFFLLPHLLAYGQTDLRKIFKFLMKRRSGRYVHKFNSRVTRKTSVSGTLHFYCLINYSSCDNLKIISG